MVSKPGEILWYDVIFLRGKKRWSKTGVRIYNFENVELVFNRKTFWFDFGFKCDYLPILLRFIEGD